MLLACKFFILFYLYGGLNWDNSVARFVLCCSDQGDPWPVYNQRSRQRCDSAERRLPGSRYCLPLSETDADGRWTLLSAVSWDNSCARTDERLSRHNGHNSNYNYNCNYSSSARSFLITLTATSDDLRETSFLIQRISQSSHSDSIRF